MIQSKLAVSFLALVLAGCSGATNASCGEVTSRLSTLESILEGLPNCNSLSDEIAVPETDNPDYSAELYGSSPRSECENSNSQITFQAESAFTSFAQSYWMNVEDEDLKSALRELGEGNNEGANYSALLAKCL
jgi:hypothetical protein